MKTVACIFLTLLIYISVYSQNLEKRLDSLLQGHFNEGEIHGCIAYVAQQGKTVLFKTYGFMDVENERLMEKDAIFRIASMTKPLVAAAALKLYEEGKLSLEDPVKKYIPEFGKLKVLSPECKSIDNLITIPLERDVTIRDLLRHTAGFGYGGNDIVGKICQRNFGGREISSLRGFSKAILSAPLKYQPGSKWEYSYASDLVGYLVEVVSGKPLDEYMNEAIFKPLKMESTGFYLSKDKMTKLCNFYAYQNKKLMLVEDPKTSSLAYKPQYFSGGGGAVSSAEDYAKFCQMLLNFGAYDDKQILKRETVEQMISNQIGEITDRSFSLPGYGLGIGVIPDKSGKHTQSCYWSGSLNTTFMIDFDKKMYAILLIQIAPWSHLNLMSKFGTIVNEETKE